MISSEASYLKSLDILVTHFMTNEALKPNPNYPSEDGTEVQMLDRHQYHFLFSGVGAIKSMRKYLFYLIFRFSSNVYLDIMIQIKIILQDCFKTSLPTRCIASLLWTSKNSHFIFRCERAFSHSPSFASRRERRLLHNQWHHPRLRREPLSNIHQVLFKPSVPGPNPPISPQPQPRLQWVAEGVGKGPQVSDVVHAIVSHVTHAEDYQVATLGRSDLSAMWSR